MNTQNRLVCVGDVTAAGKQFLTGLHSLGVGPFVYEKVQAYCEAPAKGVLQAIFVEGSNDSRGTIQKIRATGKRIYLVWFGRAFSKEDLAFAMENKVFAIFENTRPDDKKVQEAAQRLVKAMEQIAAQEQMLQSIKGILIQAEAELPKPLLTEIKTAVTKLERHTLDPQFTAEGQASQQNNDAKLMFHRTQTFGDSLETIQELERTGVLWVRGGLHGEEGKVEFLQGKIVAAQTGDVHGLKAVYRMFLWDEPKFLFTRRDPKEATMADHLTASIQHICADGEAQKERYQRIRKDLPPNELKLEVEPSSLHSGVTLKPNEFSTLASVVEFKSVTHVLDYNVLPDVAIYEALIALKKNKMIRVHTG